MSFQSTQFWIFFAAIFAVLYWLPQRFRWVLLLGASYFFYARTRPVFLLLLVAPTLLAYGAARWLERIQVPKKKRLVFWTSLALVLGVLVVCKYLDLLGETIWGLLGPVFGGAPFRAFDWILPLGVSFYTFRLISYLADVYLGKLPAERHLGLLALYVSYFPQLLAGPIERAGPFIAKLRAPAPFDCLAIESGVVQIAWGFFKKMVVADRLALFVTHVFASPEHQGAHLLFGAYFYAFQIYCDFSGYSDIAIGLSRMLGIESVKNFDRPYGSRSITQFWSRWHMSLSHWLRDYLFLPVAYGTMNRIPGERLLGIKAEYWSYAAGTLVTMFLGGLWHGASWNFVIWGLVLGFFMILSNGTKNLRKRWARRSGLKNHPHWQGAIGLLLTFHMVSFAWVFFRAPTLGAAYRYLHWMQFKLPLAGVVNLGVDAGLILIFLLIETLAYRLPTLPAWQLVPRPVKLAGFALFCVLTIVLSIDTSNEFIYFRF
ncbi:MAG TPA: MBOAT family O-acyltransferase [Candidatus Aminicenantes bacterium]|nr:MBOAT family O-acyltransferase [Candidatus Aminicenantes bacterium]